jgi:hypothetical protein
MLQLFTSFTQCICISPERFSKKGASLKSEEKIKLIVDDIVLIQQQFTEKSDPAAGFTDTHSSPFKFQAGGLLWTRLWPKAT